jgi:allophanate hydrolase subunit 2
VAIAAGFTGVYPTSSPGGWHLLGRAPAFRAFDPSSPEPFLLTPGRLVRFVPVETEPLVIQESIPLSPAEPSLRVLAAPACATVQDRGRHGRLGVGLPPSGPLDPETHARANLAAGNGPGAAAIEIPLGSLEVEALRRVVLSVDGEPPCTLEAGERLRVPTCGRAVRYLGVRGGVEVPAVLGARAALLSARLGGHAARPLRRGDTLAAGPDAGPSRPSAAPDDPPAVPELRFTPGPHLDRFAPGALDLLCGSGYRVSRLGDRVGVRLEGPPLPVLGGRLDRPVPMVRGCIEISTDGAPIVLGPDHPTTGGYPLVGTLTVASQTMLARLAPGREIRLKIA